MPDLPDHPDPDLHELLQRLTVAQHRFERSMAAALDVDRTSLEVVHRLVVDGPGTPSQLARATGLSPALTTQVLQRLDTGGHVRRSPHPEDRRKVVVDVEPATTARASDLVAPVLAALDAAVADLDADGRRVVARFLTAATDAYRERGPR